LILTALSGVGGIARFFAAFLLRTRSWAAFGVRRTAWRGIAIGAGFGVVAFFAKGLAILAHVSLTGDDRTPQGVYRSAARAARDRIYDSHSSS
jgi:hypothetical protein